MKIIDYSKKGNIVRFYLGEKTRENGWGNPASSKMGQVEDWVKEAEYPYGDDWDDRPYEHNSGTVYEEFIKGKKDIAFGFDDLVLEPCDGYINNSIWCKEDMVKRQVPCIIVVPYEVRKDTWENDFDYWNEQTDDRIKKFYFGDELSE